MGEEIRDTFQRLFDRPLFGLLAAVGGGVLGFAASIVALGTTFGVWPVAGASGGGILLVAILWYWARLLRRLQALAPSQELQDERDQYEKALAAIANRGSRQVQHHSAVITYEMGVAPDLDQITEDYVTSQGRAEHPLLWHEVRVNVIGAQIPRLGSFRELKQITSYQVDGQVRYGLLLLPAGNAGRGLRGVAIFEPEVGAIPRTWGWSCRWPVFNPLRQSKQDTVGFEVLPAVTFEHLELHVILPEHAVKPRMQPTEPLNTYTAALRPKEAGDRRWEFVAVLENPQPGYYLWTVTVERFEAYRPTP